MNRLVAVLMCICVCVGSLSAKTNFVESDFFAEVKEDDKVAVLMVHFGTSHDDTRAKTIDALNARVKESFEGLELREAWTSRIIIRILSSRGELIPTPREALEQLASEGYTRVLIQSSNVIEGVEMESLRLDVREVKDKFKDVRIGNPLLYAPEDYRVVAEFLQTKKPKDEALVLVGHGTYTPATAQYAMMQYVLDSEGYNGIILGTVEGYPSYDDMLARLKKEQVKKVVLMPFMFVAGQHAKQDIAGDWKESLEKEGYTVSVLMEGLGEQAQVQQLLLDHLRFATKNQMYDIMDKKEGYSRGESF